MSDITDIKPIEVISKEVSRRNFIKGVIASGAAVSSANYLFRAATLFGQTPGASGTERLITINVNGQQRRVDVLKQETLAWTSALQAGPYRHETGLRPRRVRRVHCPD